MATLVLSSVGNIFLPGIGGFLGAAVGAAIDATLIAPLLTPENEVKGPRLRNFDVQSNDEGAPIARMFGPSTRIAGQLIWFEGPVEVRNKSREGGKFGGGGTVVTEYSYYAHVAVALGEGFVANIQRIYANRKLFFDLDNPPTAGSHRFTQLVFHSGGNDDIPANLIETFEGVGNVPAFNGISYIELSFLQLADFGNLIPSFEFEVIKDLETYNVSELLTDLMLGAGFDSSEFDVTGVTGACRGFNIRDPQPQANALEQVFLAYDVVARGATDDIIKFLDRGDEDRIDVVAGDLVKRQDRDGRPFEITDPSDIRFPKEVSVQYQDTTRDNQIGSQSSRRINATTSNTQSLDLAMTLTPSEARGIADRRLYSQWAERQQVKFQLPPSMLEVQESDIIVVTYKSIRYHIRVVNIRQGANFVLQVEGVIESKAPGLATPGSPSQVVVAPPADDSSIPPNTVYDPPTVDAIFLDLPALTYNEALQPGYRYGHAKTTGDQFLSVTYYQSQDENGTYIDILVSPVEMIFGTADTVLAGGVDHHFWDEVSTVDVTLKFGTLTSKTESEVLAGENLALLGEEIIAFKTATLIGASQYRLSGLLRGRRDTDDKMSTHAINEAFALLSDEGGLRYQALGFNDLQSKRFYKVAPLGQTDADVSAIEFTPVGKSLEPFKVADFQGVREANDDWTLTWIRRSRAPFRELSLVTPPVLESREYYEIDIMNGPTVVNTYTVEDTTTFVYTSAQQTADFGSPQSSITVRIYEMSDTLGRGHEVEETF